MWKLSFSMTAWRKWAIHFIQWSYTVCMHTCKAAYCWWENTELFFFRENIFWHEFFLFSTQFKTFESLPVPLYFEILYIHKTTVLKWSCETILQFFTQLMIFVLEDVSFLSCFWVINQCYQILEHVTFHHL